MQQRLTMQRPISVEYEDDTQKFKFIKRQTLDPILLVQLLSNALYYYTVVYLILYGCDADLAKGGDVWFGGKSLFLTLVCMRLYPVH